MCLMLAPPVISTFGESIQLVYANTDRLRWSPGLYRSRKHKQKEADINPKLILSAIFRTCPTIPQILIKPLLSGLNNVHGPVSCIALCLFYHVYSSAGQVVFFIHLYVKKPSLK